MPLDAQSQVLIDEMNAFAADYPPYHTLSPETLRTIMKRPSSPKSEMFKVEDRPIPGPAGDITIRVYTPSEGGPFPLLVWYYGGGWVIGNLDVTDGSCRRLAEGAQCVVASIQYRLAPENKFPAGVEDCYAATAWLAKNAATINADATRLAVGGASAGGNLSAVVSLMARDRGGPPVALQIMVVPMTDRNFETKSYLDNAEGYWNTRAWMMYFWDHYLKDESDAKNPYAAPLQAKDLSGLPPALIMTAEYDPLRDDGAAYAERLKQAGVPTTYICYKGTTHGFFSGPSRIDKGKEAVAQAVQALRTAFAS